MKLAWTGWLLFLPVPAVLLAFTRYPFGIPLSVGLGLVLVATHRLYARPFALRHAGRRCLWCGGDAPTPLPIEVVEPGAESRWVACTEPHRVKLRAFLGWAERHGAFLRVGILGGLAIFLPLLLAAHWETAGPWRPQDASALFRGIIALTVLPLGWLGLRGEGSDRPRVPFPVHIQALIGSFWVMSLFRFVGIFWLATAILHAFERLGG